MRYAYPAILTPEPEGAITVTFDGIDGVTFGATEAEALRHAHDVLEGMLASYVERGLPIPRPGAARGRPMVGVTPLIAAKLALHSAMLEERETKVGLARRLGVTESIVRRLLDLDHRSHIDGIVAALDLLGREVEVQVRPRKAA